MGESLSSFAAPLGVLFAHEAELSAVIIAIKHAPILQISHLWIECDNLYVVSLLQNRDSRVPWHLRRQWQECLNILASMHIHVSHIYREGNFVADRLSLLGLHLHHIKWWLNHPMECNDLIIHDALGKENFRLSS